jgi:hypothetical protein
MLQRLPKGQKNMVATHLPTAETNGHNRLAETPFQPFGDGAHNGELKADGITVRESNGRFGIGNPGGPGNPFGRRLAALRSAFLNAATEERLQELSEKLFQMALGGDVAAAKLFLAYAVGKPTEGGDPDRLDLEEYAQFLEHPTRAQAFLDMIRPVGLAGVLQLLRGIAERKADAFVSGVMNPAPDAVFDEEIAEEHRRRGPKPKQKARRR